jgi:orotate phosphoribosyltransferase
VISAGTSVRESLAIIDAAGAKAVGVAISLDREERGTGALSAAREVERAHGLRVISIAGLRHLVEHLAASGPSVDLERLEAYRARYGAKV